MRGIVIFITRALIDIVVVGACIACILHMSRRRAVECSWQGLRASCTVESEDSLGRVERETIDGIRSAAYRSGAVVGLVTDAQHHGEHALFGTREIELGDDADAVRLNAFAADHEPERISITSGVAHPRLMTGLLLAGLLAYGVLTRRRKKK